MNSKKGFTLIELLVVVAIIAILAAVVVALLGNARNQGEDSAIKTNLSTIRNQSELFASDNGNSYLPVGSVTPFGPSSCPVYSSSGTNMFSKDSIIAAAVAEATLRGNGSYCYNSTNAWAVAVGLKADNGSSWCIDNTNSNSKQVASAPSLAINAVTFACN